MKYLIPAFVLLIATPAFGQVSTSGLSEVQKAEIEMQAAKMREDNENSPQRALETAKEWSELGTGVGTALVSVSKELGMAADEFSQTSVGKITVAVIVWKVMGAEVVRKLSAILFLFVAIPLWMKYFRKLAVVESIEYHENGKKKRVNHYNVSDYSTGGVIIPTRWVMMFLLLGIIATGLIILLI
jgi:hypothetical protein